MTPFEQAFACIMIPVVVVLAYVAGSKRVLEVLLIGIMKEIVDSYNCKEPETDCKWLYSEICCNDKCPVCCDFCPVVNYPGVCRFEEVEHGNDE